MTLAKPSRATFKHLADEWERDTAFMSNTAIAVRHPAYQRIIAMGEPAVPWLLDRLAAKPDHWFAALHAITGATPVPPEHRGRLAEMTAAWLKWGKAHGYRG